MLEKRKEEREGGRRKRRNKRKEGRKEGKGRKRKKIQEPQFLRLITCGALLEFPKKENTRKRAKVVATSLLSPYKKRPKKVISVPIGSSISVRPGQFMNFLIFDVLCFNNTQYVGEGGFLRLPSG